MNEEKATSDAAAAESQNAAANAKEAELKAQRALLAEAVAEGAKIHEPRIKALEEGQKKHTEMLEKIATKEDVQEIIKIFANIKTAATIVTATGKWGYRTILVLAGLIGAVGIITGGAKAALISLLAWATK